MDTTETFYANTTVDVQVNKVPFVVQGLELNYANCHSDRVLVEAPFLLEYIDGTDDIARQMIVYDPVGSAKM